MTIRGPDSVTTMLVGGFDVLSALTDIDVVQSAITENTKAPFGTSWDETKFVGVRMFEMKESGFYDDGVGSFHEAMSAGVASTGARVLCYGDQGTATGAEFTGCYGAYTVNYKRMAQRGQLVKADVTYQFTGVVEHGKIIKALTTRTSSGTSSGTPVDNVTSSTGATGGAGYLQVTAMDTLDHATVKLRHSSDNVTFADLVTFTVLSSAVVPFAQRAVISATAIERYVYEDHSFASATTLSSITFFTGLVRGNG